MEKNIVKVIKISEPHVDFPYFAVYLDDQLKKCFCFKENESENSIYYEGKNRVLAIEFARKLEKGEFPAPEIVYTNEKTN